MLQMQGAAGGPAGMPSDSRTRQGMMGDVFASLLEKKIGNREWNWFEYQCTWETLLASAAGQVSTIQIESDSDFLAFACVGIARTVAGALLVDTSFLIQGRSTGSGNDLFQAPTDWAMVVGTAQNPAWWGMPRLMARSSTYTFSLQNLVATAFNVRLGFWGIKVYLPRSS